MSFVVIDLASGRVTAANAGHHPAVVLSGDGAETVFNATGPPTGVLPESVWQDESAELQSGATVLLYTDGIVEARDGSIDEDSGEPDVEYQLDRLIRLTASRNGDDPHALIESILVDVTSFCAPRLPHDDCTMIALRYRGG
jgi:serine phosphatase RsbU (regulator of sigma subunit)